MAPEEPADCQVAAAPEAMNQEGLPGVGRTGRGETAAPRLQGTQKTLVATYEKRTETSRQ